MTASKLLKHQVTFAQVRNVWYEEMSKCRRSDRVKRPMKLRIGVYCIIQVLSQTSCISDFFSSTTSYSLVTVIIPLVDDEESAGFLTLLLGDENNEGKLFDLKNSGRMVCSNGLSAGTDPVMMMKPVSTVDQL